LFTVNPAATLRLGLWVALSIVMMTVDHRYHYSMACAICCPRPSIPLQYPDAGCRTRHQGLAYRESGQSGVATLLEENARLREKQIFSTPSCRN
jgi:hypothetical protein